MAAQRTLAFVVIIIFKYVIANKDELFNAANETVSKEANVTIYSAMKKIQKFENYKYFNILTNVNRTLQASTEKTKENCNKTVQETDVKTNNLDSNFSDVTNLTHEFSIEKILGEVNGVSLYDIVNSDCGGAKVCPYSNWTVSDTITIGFLGAYARSKEYDNVLTTGAGAPVDYRDTYGLNKPIFTNEHFVREITSLVRERIPERPVHANGAGAFGYFEVSNDITHICKAKMFSKVGKKTPIAMRFSSVFTDRGRADTTREARGYAVKFYTEEGNFDIAGLNTRMFGIKDPVLFSSEVHAFKNSPVTGYIKDGDTVWDFALFHPEIIHILLVTFGDQGIPKGFQYMPGYAIHTYQVSNCKGDINFVRFHFIPEAGIKNMYNEEARYLSGLDPDYHKRDLYTRIEKGEYPSWTLFLQILSPQDVRNATFDVFDLTKVLPLKTYPLTPVGRLVLNKNPTNYFDDVELIFFNPGSLVPGIQGSPDKMFEARRMAYRDAQNYRLGGNHENIPVNCPINGINNYARDGVPPLGNTGPGPNYYPNTFDGPKPYEEKNRVELVKIVQDDLDNFEQSAELYNEMTNDERDRLVENIVSSMKSITRVRIMTGIVRVFMKIHPDLGSRIKQGLEKRKQELGQYSN